MKKIVLKLLVCLFSILCVSCQLGDLNSFLRDSSEQNYDDQSSYQSQQPVTSEFRKTSDSIEDNSLLDYGGSNGGDNGIGKATVTDTTEDFLKQVNSLADAGISTNFKSQSQQDDQSIDRLLHSFRSDDQSGNVFHHSDHESFMTNPGAIQEEMFNNEVENPQNREGGIQGPTAFDSPDYQVTKEVRFAMTEGGMPIGEILIGLFGNTVPKTVANFVALANGEVLIIKLSNQLFNIILR